MDKINENYDRKISNGKMEGRQSLYRVSTFMNGLDMVEQLD